MFTRGAKYTKTKIGRFEDDRPDHIETNQNTNVQLVSSWSHLQPALKFNGSGDYLQFPSSPLLDEISQVRNNVKNDVSDN